MTLVRVTVTAVTLVVAAVATRQLWTHYQLEPWTRNGRVRADVVRIAPDVSGLVTDISVRDNQVVKRGEVLFVIDQARFALALKQAQSEVASKKAAMVQAQREATRNRDLGRLVSQEVHEQGMARLQQEQAALEEAVARRDTAALNLERATVRAPVNGMVTNMELRPGDYASAGQSALALVDSDTFRVEGYFEETKLRRIHVGDAVSVRLMGEEVDVHGHVESIASGIEDRDRARSPDGLANVNPTFNWVRLAQRVPVRVALDQVPPEVRLIAGRTASVTVLPEGAAPVRSAAR